MSTKTRGKTTINKHKYKCVKLDQRPFGSHDVDTCLYFDFTDI